MSKIYTSADQLIGHTPLLVCGGINLTHNREPSLYVNQKMFYFYL